jgi:hypothetical protein
LIDYKIIIETITKMGPAIYPLAYGAAICLIILIALVMYYALLLLIKH